MGGGQEGPGAACGSTDGHMVTATRGLLTTSKATERKPRLHVHAGRLGGGSVEGTEEGCQETAVWEQGQERTSGQQLRSQRKALGLDAGGKKVLEEMKEHSRPSVPVLGQSLPFLHDKQTQNNPNGTERETHWRYRGQSPGVKARLGRVSWLCTRRHKRCTCSSSWKPASLGAWSAGFGSFLLQSFKSVPVPQQERLARPPPAAPTWGYTSVEKYSVFRFSSAKEMGGCCR